MQVGFISDIHANLPALEAVWKDLHKRKVDMILCAGDLVSFGPHPAEVVDFFIAHDIKTVLGNHDAVAIGLSDPAIFEYPNEEDRAYVLASSIRTAEVLSPHHLAYFETLPLEIIMPEISLVLTHCVPDMYTYPTPDAANEYMAGRKERFLFFGHTHYFMIYSLLHDKLAINIPSVGKPRHGDPQAGYCIAKIEGQQLQGLEYHFCEYDRKGVCEEIIEKKHPLRTLRYLEDKDYGAN